MKLTIGLIAAALFLIAGLFVFFFVTAYRFTGMILMGIAGVILCFCGISVFSVNHINPAKALRLILTSLLIITGFFAIVTGALIKRDAESSPSVFCRYLVVLGAGVDGTTPSRTLSERIDAAYNYLNRNLDAIAVLSGGKGDGERITEAECMYRELTARGIDPDRLRKEDQAVNTSENIRFSLDLIEQETGTRPTEIGLISNDYHLHRACMLADRQGVTAYGIPAHSQIFTLKVNYFLRQFPAVWYYSIIGG